MKSRASVLYEFTNKEDGTFDAYSMAGAIIKLERNIERLKIQQVATLKDLRALKKLLQLDDSLSAIVIASALVQQYEKLEY